MHTQKKVVCLDVQSEYSDSLKTDQTIDFVLQKNGFEVIHSPQEEQVVNVVCQETPDIILIDINQDMHSVWDIYRQIRQSNRTCNIPIILITAKVTRIEDILQLYAANAADCLVKPFAPQELMTSINKVLLN